MDEPEEMIIRSLEDPTVSVRLYDRYLPDQYGVGFSVEIRADGLHANIGPVEVWVWDSDTLPGFLATLAEDFRGWTEERSWRRNRIVVDAVYHSRGHVELTWTLAAWDGRQESWRATVTTWVEAGAMMATLADDMHEFLRFPHANMQDR